MNLKWKPRCAKPVFYKLLEFTMTRLLSTFTLLLLTASCSYLPSMDNILPDSVQWKAHNYNHLHEQPTVFYAVAIVLAIVGQGDGMNALLAWMYAGLRIIHSLVQVTANRVLVRFVLFALSSLVLIALIFHATIFVFDIHF